MTGAFAFILGLVGGSFVNAVVWRLDKNERIVWARSKCVHCHHTLAAGDLVPLISFLWLNGRCRYCRKNISWQYPAVELAAGLGFWVITQSGLSPENKIWLAGLFLIGLVIFVYDLKYTLIPNVFIAVGLVWTLAGILFLEPSRLISGLSAGVVISVFFLILYLVSKGAWIGGGDIKLGFLMGLWLGWPMAVAALLFSYIIGAIIGLALIAIQKATFKSQIPFGPFLITGAVAAYVFGSSLLESYFGLFL
ncbi:MAG: prepilin peptidase [Patescibacteria group bacterium]|mgnify:CR=1 FL=1